MIVTVSGSNDFARKAELKRLVSDFVAEHGDLALERLDASELELGALLDAVQSLPFLSPRRMIVLGEPSVNKSIAEKFEQVIDNVNETTDLIISEPKPDKRSVYYKLLKKKTELREFNQLDGRELAQWLAGEARARGGSLSTSDAQYLVERVGIGQLMLSNELDKLLAYDPAIKRASIDLLTEPAPQSKIFDLLDAAFAGNHKRAMQLYHDQRAQRVEPQQILALLIWQLHILALVKAAGNKSSQQIASEARISPYTAGKTQNIARRLSMAEVKKLVADALDLDVRLKSEAVDADAALQHFLLSI
jgi:DNA polymerase-3 subunit delta